MKKMKDLIGRLGEKLFPGLPEKKRQRITAQVIVGVFLVLASLAGIWICHCRTGKQIEKYQAIAEAYAQPGSMSDGTKGKSQKKTVNKIKRIFLEMKEDAEKYRQEHEAEMQENSIEAYDWDALCSVNEDIKGWLYIPDTLINFPVVGTDDNSFYLSHDFTGEKSSAGCPFMDKDTQVWDFNRVIYGHNMGAGSDAMFSTLLDYEKEDYLRENQTIYFTDAYGSTTTYQVMAVVKYDIADLDEWDFRIRNHADMESYDAWMEELQGRALYYAEPDHAPTSIITLATCDRRVHGKKGRFLVIAGR